MPDLLDENLPAALAVLENDSPVADSQSEAVGNTVEANHTRGGTRDKAVQRSEHPTPSRCVQASSVATCTTG